MNTYVRDNTEFLFDNLSYTAVEVVTATDATWSVPTLGNPIVRVTCVGGGGGGGLADGTSSGSTGGTTTFAVGESYEFSAAGGVGGKGGTTTTTVAGSAGIASANGGQASTNAQVTGNTGNGGFIVTRYADLTGETTLNLVVGAGGSSGGGASGAGGRGEIIVEYVAG
jgi:hypothetical protein